MDAARKFVEKGQTDKAIKEYLRIVKEDPQDVRVWLKIGDLYAKKGAKAEAIDTYLKVAKFYGEQGFYLKAVAVYKQILKLDPRLIEVNLKLAELYRQLGLMSDAMRHFEMVAGHFHREGKTKEAMATVRQLVDLDPENVATRIKLAELYSKEGMVEDAVTEFTKACEYLRTNNRPDDFIKVAERLLWHKPDNNELNRELAGMYLRRNDPRRALQKLQICFKANPRDVETLAFLAQAFQALEQKSKTVQVLKELARVLDEDGKRDRAKDVHRKILAFVPNDPDSTAYLGQAQQSRAAEVPAPPPPPPPPSESAAQRLVMSKDVVPRRAHNPTGSMPLLDSRAIAAYGYQSAKVAEKPPEKLVDKPEEKDFTSEFTQDSSLVEGSAAAERHSEQIAKLLTETEVYIKYGLHQKAIDHLRQVFNLDDENIEARERLKEILLGQGREREAITELMRLAEITAPLDHERAAGYLREILGLDGTYQPAFALAERYRLDLTGEAEIEILDELEHTSLRGGGVAPIEDELDFGDLDFQEDGDLLDPGATQERTRYSELESFEFDLDDASDEPDAGDSLGGAGATMEIGVGDAKARFRNPDQARSGKAGGAYPYTSPGGHPRESLADPLFDPDDAAAFDAEPGFDPATFTDEDDLPAGKRSARPERASGYGGFGHNTKAAPASRYDANSFDPGPTREYGASIYDQAGAGAGYELSDLDAEPLLDLGEFAVDFEVPSDQRPTQDLGGVRTKETKPANEFEEQTRTGPSVTTDTNIDLVDESLVDLSRSSAAGTGHLEDDLDEAEFFISQGLYDEARNIIHGLLSVHPENPFLLAKLQELDRMGGDATTSTPAPNLDFEEIDSIDDLDAMSTVTPGGSTQTATRPAVLLEKPVEDSDADTHYDLGLAYKEMGLYEEAIKAFSKVTDAPGREVQSRLMIGMCYREQGSLTDAIQQFKAALHAPSIVDREQLSCYYEIATSYELLGDFKEALYFYGMISKKDSQYRDVLQRTAALANGGGRGRMGRGRPSSDDAEDAIDSLLIETENPRRGG